MVCISKEVVEAPLADLPFYCHTEGYQYFPHFPRLKTVARIEYLAARRNAAVQALLDKYPETTDVFMLDTYYLDQTGPMRQLIHDYESLPENTILGASTWFKNPSRIPAYFEFWDSWTNPEYNRLQFKHAPHGVREATGAGGFAIYPRWVWEKQKYGVPYPFPESGCEVNYLSRCPGTRTLLSFDVRAWRDPPEELRDKPFIDRVRTTLGIGTRLRRFLN